MDGVEKWRRKREVADAKRAAVWFLGVVVIAAVAAITWYWVDGRHDVPIVRIPPECTDELDIQTGPEPGCNPPYEGDGM